ALAPKQSGAWCKTPDCFAEPVIGRAFARPGGADPLARDDGTHESLFSDRRYQVNWPGRPGGNPHVPKTSSLVPFLARLGVEKLENLACALGADARDLAEVGDRGPLDLLQRSEVKQQGALAGRADTGNFLQTRFANVFLAQLAVRADHETVRFVAQPLDEIQNGVARLELDRLAVGQEQGFASGVAVRSFRHAQQRHLGQAEFVQGRACRVELAS